MITWNRFSIPSPLRLTVGTIGTPLIASGFIAGGALMGVVSALLKFGGVEASIADSWWVNPMSEVCSLIAYICLIGFFIRATKK